MSVVNHDEQFIFMHEPHTAGRAIEAVLMQLPGSCNFNGNHHISAIEMIDSEWVTEEQFDEYLKFRVVRNPYEWLITAWIRYDKEDTSFCEWATTKGLGLMTFGTLFWRYHNNVDHNIRYEHLPGALSDLLSIDLPDMPRIGVIEDKPDWRDFLTVRQASHLEELYPDIREFGYNLFRYDFERAG